MRHPKAPRRTASALAITAAIAFSACLILRFGLDYPYLDQWDYSFLFEKYSQGQLSLSDLFRLQLEHRQFFPEIVFLFLGRLSAWDVRYEMLASFVTCLIAARTLFAIERRTLPERWLWPLFAVSIVLLFSPVQVTNWLNGVQLTYYAPICGLMVGLALCCSDFKFPLRFTGCFVLAGVCSFCIMNGLLLWLLFPPALLLLRRSTEPSRRAGWIGLWLAGFAAALTLYFYDYHKPGAHPGMQFALSHPLEAAAYLLSVIGRPFSLYGLRSCDMYPLEQQAASRAVVFSVAIGLVILIFAAGLLWKALGSRLEGRDLQRFVVPLLILMFGGLSAVMVTFGRSGFGSAQSLTPRYTTFMLTIPIALVMSTAILADLRPKLFAGAGSKLAIRGVLVVLTAVQLALFPIGYAQACAFQRRMLQSQACLVWGPVMPDSGCLRQMTRDPTLLMKRAEGIDRLGYLRPALKKTDKPDLSNVPPCPGAARSVKMHEADELVVLKGSSYDYDRHRWVDAVVLGCRGPDNRDRLFKLAAFSDDAHIFGFLWQAAPPQYLDWQAEISPLQFWNECSGKLTVYAYDVRGDRLCRVGEVARSAKAVSSS